jgi:hypothetical protein
MSFQGSQLFHSFSSQDMDVNRLRAVIYRQVILFLFYLKIPPHLHRSFHIPYYCLSLSPSLIWISCHLWASYIIPFYFEILLASTPILSSTGTFILLSIAFLSLSLFWISCHLWASYYSLLFKNSPFLFTDSFLHRSFHTPFYCLSPPLSFLNKLSSISKLLFLFISKFYFPPYRFFPPQVLSYSFLLPFSPSLLSE